MFGNISVFVLILRKKCLSLHLIFSKNSEKMTNHEHPIIANASSIEEQGIAVYDDIRSMPVYNEPFTSPFFVSVLNLSGHVKAEYDLHPVEFHPHDISVLEPNHIVNARESSADYHALVFVLSPRLHDEMRSRLPSIYRDNFHFHSKAHFHLTDTQFESIRQVFLLLRTASFSASSRRKDMIADLLEVFFLLLQEYLQQNGIVTQQPSYRERVFSNFYDALVEHYRQSREVRFYADLLCLSPKHFAAVVKTQTGITASEWINSYVTIQAKSLLHHQQQMTIQQISDHLGFPDQAAFSRYFKNATGLSPTEYKERA